MGSILRYHGGKVRLAPKLISLMPRRTCYVEPFGGGAAVLLAKPRSKLEIYNDLSGEMVALFRVIRDRGEDLARIIACTPFSREEHELAYQATDSELEAARRVLVRSHFGFGSNGIFVKTGFRASGFRSGSLPVHNWQNLPPVVLETMERLRGVVIEQRPAIDVMLSNDSAETVYYVDPPYVAGTRDAGSDYAHEMTDANHLDLLDVLQSLKGAVVLSGYAHPIYDDALTDWRRVTIDTVADGARPRTEVVWMNFEDCPPLFVASNTNGEAA